MRNIINKVMILGLILVLLSACKRIDLSAIYKLEKNGDEVTIKYTYKNDKILKQVMDSRILYKNKGLNSIAQARSILDPVKNKYNSVVGVKINQEFKEDHYLEHLEIDFSELDLSQVSTLPNHKIIGDIKEGISMNVTKTLLLEQGFIEVEEEKKAKE